MAGGLPSHGLFSGFSALPTCHYTGGAPPRRWHFCAPRQLRMCCLRSTLTRTPVCAFEGERFTRRAGVKSLAGAAVLALVEIRDGQVIHGAAFRPDRSEHPYLARTEGARFDGQPDPTRTSVTIRDRSPAKHALMPRSYRSHAETRNRQLSSYTGAAESYRAVERDF